MGRQAARGDSRAILSLLTLGMLLGVSGCSREHGEPAVAASTAPVQPRAISCLGKITPGDRIIKIAAPPQAIVKELLVARGSHVRAGQKIAVLRDYDVAAAALAQARSEVALAESAVSQAKAGDKPAAVAAQQAAIESQQSILRNAESELRRNKDLSRNGLLSTAEVEASQLRVDTARHNIRRETELLQSLQQVRSEDVQVAQRKLELSITKERHATTELNRNQITSPSAGTVLEIHTYPGEAVTSDGILDLGDLGNMFVLAEVYLNDVPRVREGARATITGEGFLGTVTGKVEEVLRQASGNRLYPVDAQTAADKRVLGVRIRLDNSQKVQHLTNSQVSVRIEP